MQGLEMGDKIWRESKEIRFWRVTMPENERLRESLYF
jgi:hypothetical protein